MDTEAEDEMSLFMATGDDLSPTVSHFESQVAISNGELLESYEQIIAGKKQSLSLIHISEPTRPY